MTGPAGADQLLTPDSAHWEKCARHQNKQTTRFVATFFSAMTVLDVCAMSASTIGRPCLKV